MAPAVAKCLPGEETPLVENGTPAGARESWVTLKVIDPPNNQAVNADSVIGVEIEFRVADFEPGKHHLMVMFPSLVSSMSPGGPDESHELRHAAGRVRLCVPLREVYENSRVRWPLQVYAVVQEQLPPPAAGGRTYQQVVASASESLNSVDAPRATLRAQSATVNPEYRDAVGALSQTISQIEAAGQVCPGVQDLAVEFQAAYGGWVSRNAPVVERVRRLQHDLYSRDMQKPEYVEQILKLTADAARARFTELPDAQLRAQCQYFSRAFSNPRSDLETAGAAQLAVIQARAPADLATQD